MKFKLNFYRNIFQCTKERESSLSASEAYAAEVIFALEEPTVSQFASFLHISQPNATYKVNTLVRKGFIEKVKSSTDGREYHLRTTPYFMECYAKNLEYIDTLADRMSKRFSKDEIEQLVHMLTVMSNELMPENENGLLIEALG
jgi:DNA-binding MarR family transcriptional regulator